MPPSYLLLTSSCFEIRRASFFFTVAGLAPDTSGRCPKLHRCSQRKTPHCCPLPLSSLLPPGIEFSLCRLAHGHISGNIQQRLARLPTLVPETAIEHFPTLSVRSVDIAHQDRHRVS